MLALECLFVFLAFPLCPSMGTPCLSHQPQFQCEGAFLFPMLCTEVPSSYFQPLRMPLSLCSPPSRLILVENTPLLPPKVNTRVFSVYLFCVAGEVVQFSEVGEHIEAPPCILHLVYMYSFLFSSPCISVWGNYVLTLMFEWIGAFSPALSPGV